ncbi:hypothetical protein [Aquabacterium sp. A7-Y]|uniref:hypothetical protein n=1 Tax=Aquabacterium sp. A7-Y TaxID=1349605 RepID=UPI0039FD1540
MSPSEGVTMTLPEFDKFFNAERARWATVVKQASVRLVLPRGGDVPPRIAAPDATLPFPMQWLLRHPQWHVADCGEIKS